MLADLKPGTGTTTYPLVICADTTGNILWSRQFNYTVGNSWKSVDIRESQFNSFSVLNYSDSLIAASRVDFDGNIVWSKVYNAKNQVSPVGIAGDSWDTYIAYNETDSGYKKGVMLVLDQAGTLQYSSKIGGNGTGMHYTFQNMQFTNLRPKITALQQTATGAPAFIKLDYSPGTSLDAVNNYTINSFTPGTGLTTALTELAEVLGSANDFSNDLHLTFTFSDNYNTPIRSKQIALPALSKLNSLHTTFDGGLLSILNTNTNDILLLKSDSAGVFSGCNSLSQNSSFTISHPTARMVSIPEYPVTMTFPPVTILQAPYAISTSVYCQGSYCPIVTEPAACASTFFKEYTTYSKSILLRELKKTTSDKLLGVASKRDNPYVVADKSVLMVLDTLGKIELAREISTSGGAAYITKTIRASDGNFISGGYIYYKADSIEYLLLKYDNQLNILWQQKYIFPERYAVMINILETAEGDLYCYINGHEHTGPETKLLFKTDATGNPVWLKRYEPAANVFPGTFRERFGAMIEAGNSLLYFYREEASDASPHIVRLSKADGQVQWVRKLKISGSNDVGFGQPVSIGNYIYYLSTVAGYCHVLKVDTAANVVAAKKIAITGLLGLNLSATPSQRLLLAIYTFTSTGNSPGIIEMDTTLAITRQQFFKGMSFLNISEAAIFSDSVHYAGGFLGSRNPYWNTIVLQKYNFNGSTGSCEAIVPLSLEDASVVVSPKSVIKHNLSLPIAVPAAIILSPTDLAYNALHCGATACTSVDVWGDSNICDSVNVYTFNLSTNGGCASDVTWQLDTLPNQVIVVDRSNSYIKLKAKLNGTIKIKAKIFGNCSWLYDSIGVTIGMTPASFDLGKDSSICAGNTLTLQAPPGFNGYEWQDGTTLPQLQINAPGKYYVTVTTACGNVLSDTINITGAAAVLLNAGPDTVKCNNDSLILTAPSGFINYSWSPDYNIISSNSQAATIFPLTDTAYFLAAEKTPGCFGYDTIRIKVNRSPSIYLGADTSICIGTTLSLDAGTGFSSYIWNTGAATRAISAATAGLYAVKATDANNCISKDTLHVTNVYNLPIVSLDKNEVLCSGIPRTIDAGNGFSYYLWSTGATSSSIATSSLGKYWVTVKDLNGCSNSDTVVLATLAQTPFGFLPVDTVLCNYTTITIRSKSPYSTYLWSNGTTQDNIIVTSAGKYWLTVKDVNGCTGTDSINIDPKQCLEGVFIPTAFTPNNDNRNDGFGPVVYGKTVVFLFEIFNRWGHKIFVSTDPKKIWDGTINGISQPAGAFVWSCTYQLEGKALKKEYGTVTLIR